MASMGKGGMIATELADLKHLRSSLLCKKNEIRATVDTNKMVQIAPYIILIRGIATRLRLARQPASRP